MTEQVLAGI